MDKPAGWRCHALPSLLRCAHGHMSVSPSLNPMNFNPLPFAPSIARESLRRVPYGHGYALHGLPCDRGPGILLLPRIHVRAHGGVRACASFLRASVRAYGCERVGARDRDYARAQFPYLFSDRKDYYYLFFCRKREVRSQYARCLFWIKMRGICAGRKHAKKFQLFSKMSRYPFQVAEPERRASSKSGRKDKLHCLLIDCCIIAARVLVVRIGQYKFYPRQIFIIDCRNIRSWYKR